MQIIDDNTQAIATGMLNVASDDWREIAAAGGVTPLNIHEVLKWDLSDIDEDKSLAAGLEAYRLEIDGQLTKGFAELLRSEHASDREHGIRFHGLLARKFWESGVLPEKSLATAIKKAIETQMQKIPQIA